MAWSPDLLAYPFLFIAIYFESFLLVTLLSRPAREARGRLAATETPHVAIIVPCWNEETTIAGTTESLLALDYPADKLSVVLVNDGSTDGTPAAMARFADHAQVTIIHKENGGKHTALNAGIAAVPHAELIGCLDADSFVASDALRHSVSCFARPQVMAATASMAVHEPHTILQRMQYAEYTFGIAVRHILSSINGLYVTPGPFSLYRASIFKELGEFRHGHQTEDMEMALRIQRAGYQIGNAVRARVYTKAPPTLLKLLKQRTRWTSGFLRNMAYDYRDLVFSSRHGALGILVLPLALLAIGSGILLFVIACVELAKQVFHFLSVSAGIPISYTFAAHTPSWFYLPLSSITLLASMLLLVTFSFMIVGKRLSRASGWLAPNIAPYALLYSFVAPLWLIRSVADVARGARRTWR